MSKVIDGKSKGGHEIQLPPFCGSFPARVDVYNQVQQFACVLAMIDLVHLRGSRKYKEYSWIMDPNAPNSNLLDNINALYRHFVAHSMGQIMDPEGLPHIFHMACRAGMFVTKYYRGNTQLEHMPYAGIEKINHLPPYTQITAEEIMCLSAGASKVYSDIPKDCAQLQPYVTSLLVDMSTHVLDNAMCSYSPLHPLKSVVEENMVIRFFLTIINYADAVFRFKYSLEDWDEFFNGIKPTLEYSIEEKAYLKKHLGITVK